MCIYPLQIIVSMFILVSEGPFKMAFDRTQESFIVFLLSDSFCIFVDFNTHLSKDSKGLF